MTVVRSSKHRLLLRTATCAVILMGLAWTSASEAEPFANLLSHRAFYTLSLDDTRSSGALAALEGRLLWQQEAACDGMTSSQRMVTRQWAAEGDGSLFDLQLSAWESEDGREMRFAQSFYLNGRLIDESMGTAHTGPSHSEIEFESPESKTLGLEAETVFPATLISQVLAVAKSGGKRHAAIVYEGDSEGEQFDIRVAIGEKKSEEASSGLLKGLNSWPVLISYYEQGSKDELPVYEIAYHLYENSVTDNVIIDYGEYAIRAELETYETLPEPKC